MYQLDVNKYFDESEYSIDTDSLSYASEFLLSESAYACDSVGQSSDEDNEFYESSSGQSSEDKEEAPSKSDWEQTDPHLLLLYQMGQCGGADGRGNKKSDWLALFQDALEQQDVEMRLELLSSVLRSFEDTCRQYGQVIISEESLPLEEKTVKPVDMGGLAGGDKFLIHGILFKFSKDVRVGGGTRWLYGGLRKRRDEAAQKASGNELIAVNSLYHGSHGLFVPLMCLVDYQGFRLTAQSLLPIDGDSLIYGSNDGTQTVKDGRDNPEILAKIKAAASEFHLASHKVLEKRTESEKELLFAADVEVHLGSDGKAYLLDLARFSPPTYPPKENPEAIFSQVFRPEFLRWYDRETLSSDALSRFGSLESEHYTQRIVRATEVLLRERIPEAAAALLSDRPLSLQLHQFGVNLRYLGHVRQCVTDELIKRQLFQEMLARAAKCTLKRAWRRRGHSRHREIATAKALWKLRCYDSAEALALVRNKFRVNPADDCLGLGQPALLERFCDLCSLHLDSRAIKAWIAGQRVFHFDIRISCRIKSMGLSQAVVAQTFINDAKDRALSVDEKKQLYQKAREILRPVCVRNPRAIDAHLNLLFVLRQLMSGPGVTETEWAELMRDSQGAIKAVELVEERWLLCSLGIERANWYHFNVGEALHYWQKGFNLVRGTEHSQLLEESTQQLLEILGFIRNAEDYAKAFAVLRDGVWHETGVFSNVQQVPQRYRHLWWLVNMLDHRLAGEWLQSFDEIVCADLTVCLPNDETLVVFAASFSHWTHNVSLAGMLGITNVGVDAVIDSSPNLHRLNLDLCHFVDHQRYQKYLVGGRGLCNSDVPVIIESKVLPDISKHVVSLHLVDIIDVSDDLLKETFAQLPLLRHLTLHLMKFEGDCLMSITPGLQSADLQQLEMRAGAFRRAFRGPLRNLKSLCVEGLKDIEDVRAIHGLTDLRHFWGMVCTMLGQKVAGENPFFSAKLATFNSPTSFWGQYAVCVARSSGYLHDLTYYYYWSPPGTPLNAIYLSTLHGHYTLTELRIFSATLDQPWARKCLRNLTWGFSYRNLEEQCGVLRKLTQLRHLNLRGVPAELKERVMELVPQLESIHTLKRVDLKFIGPRIFPLPLDRMKQTGKVVLLAGGGDPVHACIVEELTNHGFGVVFVHPENENDRASHWQLQYERIRQMGAAFISVEATSPDSLRQLTEKVLALKVNFSGALIYWPILRGLEELYESFSSLNPGVEYPRAKRPLQNISLIYALAPCLQGARVGVTATFMVSRHLSKHRFKYLRHFRGLLWYYAAIHQTIRIAAITEIPEGEGMIFGICVTSYFPFAHFPEGSHHDSASSIARKILRCLFRAPAEAHGAMVNDIVQVLAA